MSPPGLDLQRVCVCVGGCIGVCGWVYRCGWVGVREIVVYKCSRMTVCVCMCSCRSVTECDFLPH